MEYETKLPSDADRSSAAAPSAPSRIKLLVSRLASGKVTRGVAGTMMLKAVSAVTGFAMFSLAARSMSGENFGQLVMWFSVAQIACVVGLFGQEMLVTRKLGEYSATGQPHFVKGVLLFSINVAAALCAVSSLAVGAFALAVHHASFALTLTLVAFMMINAASMLGSQITRYFVGILISDGSRQFLWRIIIVAALIGSILFDHKVTPTEFLVMATATLVLVALIQAVTSWRSLPPAVGSARAQWKTRDWLSTSARLFSSSVLEATNQYFDVIVIYWLLDPIAAGGYYAASRLANLFAIVLDALFTYAARHIPPLYFGGRTDDLRRHLIQMAEVVLFCVICGLAMFTFGAKPLLSAFGSAFVDQQTTLIILAIGTAVQALGGPVAVMLLTTGHETAYTWTIAANVAMRLIGFCILIPLFGVTGAAIATAASLAITTVILNRLCTRRVGFDPSVLALVPWLRGAPASLKMAPQPVSRSPIQPS